MRRIDSVTAIAPSRLQIRWRDGVTDVIDMAGAIACFAPFKPLSDPALFATVETVAHGSGVEWANGLDFSADSLAHMAEMQRPMTGAEFAEWRTAMGLSLQQAAHLFGVSVTTVKGFPKRECLPVAVQIACRALRDDRETFAALYTPLKPGRPRAA